MNGEDEVQPTRYLICRDHSWSKAVFISMGLSMCITVDILQYSMPLAFLPSVLEDRGHSTFKIASSIGVYYWTGFAGGLIITSYQLMRLVCSGGDRPTDQTTLATVRRHIIYLIIGLSVGTVTLTCQAMSPHYNTHFLCRFIQGFAGAFIFFYSFLLSVNCFRGESEQQDFAMTAASAALNVAEVLGSLLGALLFHRWGQRSVFWFLGVMSVVNQVILVGVIFILKDSDQVCEPAEKQLTGGEMMANARSHGWGRAWKVLSSKRLANAVILILTAAIVKGAVEEMLPFHADHQWGFEPIDIGHCFAIIAISYIGAAVLAGRLWRPLGRHRNLFAAFWLAMLGLSALFVFSLAEQGMSKEVFWVGLLGYGLCLGLTHTPAALLLADAVEHEQGVAKDAVNGIWNTMWEAGGSLGFLLGGLLAHNYAGQVRLLTGTAGVCLAGATLMFIVNKTGAFGDDDDFSGETPLKQCEGSSIPMPIKKEGLSYGSAA